MAGSKLTKGNLQAKAPTLGIDPDQSYEKLREQIEIHECKWCGDEFVNGMGEGFCSDMCQVHYINEYYR